jgi:hypothetical protein
MAEIKGGLGFADPSKLNQYGAKEEDISEYQQSLQDSINALQMRYAQPNWFNVAAGFFKPQLGGFAASLGSASQAMGENLEKQREAQLPIAQMRSQLAMSKIAMGQNKQGADLLKDWEGRGSPPGEMPALAQKLESLGSTGLAAGIKGKIDTMRSTTASDQQALQIFYQKRSADIAAINTQLVGKLITPTQAAAAMREIESRVPPAATSFSPLGKTDKSAAAAIVEPAAAEPKLAENMTKQFPSAAAAPALAAAAPAAVAAAAPALAAAPAAAEPAVVAAAPAAVAAAEKKARTVIPSALSLHTETEMPEAQIAQRSRDAEALQKNALKSYEGLQAIAAPQNFNKFVVPVDNSLRLLGYEPDPTKKMDPAVQAANQKMAQEAMGMMKGSLWKGVLTAFNEGVGAKAGDFYANVNLPVQKFLAAIKNPKMQDYMRDLMQNFAQVAIQKQQLGGLNPSTGRNVEFNLFGESSPSMEHSTPKSALKNLLHMRTALYQTKSQHDFVQDVISGNHPEYEINPDTGTRFYDVLSHPAYSALQKPWLEKHADIEKHFGGK